jgi:hypothetical protein
MGKYILIPCLFRIKNKFQHQMEQGISIFYPGEMLIPLQSCGGNYKHFGIRILNYILLTLLEWKFIIFPPLSTMLIKVTWPLNAHSTTISKSRKCWACYISPLCCFTPWGHICIANGDTSSNTSCKFFMPKTCITIVFFFCKQRESTKQLHMYKEVVNINYKPLNKKFTWLLHMVKKLINFLFKLFVQNISICWSIHIVGAHFPLSFPTIFFRFLLRNYNPIVTKCQQKIDLTKSRYQPNMHTRSFFYLPSLLKKHLTAHSQRNEWCFDEKSMKFKLEPWSIVDQLASLLHIVHCPLQLFSFVSCWEIAIQFLPNVKKW